MKCEICKRDVSTNSIRIGVCWDCMEADSIITDGLDMCNLGPKNNNIPAKTSREKLSFLISKGWTQ